MSRKVAGGFPWEKGYRRKPLDPILYSLPQILADRAQLGTSGPLIFDDLVARSRVPLDMWFAEPEVQPETPAAYATALRSLNALDLILEGIG